MSLGHLLFLADLLERYHLTPALLRRIRRLGFRFGRSRFHEAADLLCRASLHIVGDMGVGVQGEARAVVAQHAGQGFHIQAAGDRHRGECVAQVVEPDIWQARLLEQHLQSAVGRVRIRRQLWAGGMWEDPLTDGSLLSLPQELYDALRQDDGACTLAGLGVAQGEYAHLFAVQGAAHFERSLLPVEVLPHQTADFTPP